MVWFKVDDSFYDHPKTEDLSDSAVALWTRAGSYCAKHLTDGFISDRKANRMCDSPATAITELTDAGLWVREADGYRFHDWHEYQPTREEALAASKAKSVGGAVGNHRRWHVERGKVDPQCPYCQAGSSSSSDRITDRITDQPTESVPNPPTRPDPTRPDLPTEGLFDAPPPATPSTTTRKRGPRQATRIPDDFAITEGMAAWAAKEMPHLDARYQTEKFRDFWTSKSGKDATKSDWPAAWRYWMRNASERSPNTQPRSSQRANGHEPYRNTHDDSDYERWVNQ